MRESLAFNIVLEVSRTSVELAKSILGHFEHKEEIMEKIMERHHFKSDDKS